VTVNKYDTIIIGGGPAGAAAAIYCARKKLNALIVTDTFGGQSTVSSGIGNWLGVEVITGEELAEKIEAHVSAQESLEIIVEGIFVEIGTIPNSEPVRNLVETNEDGEIVVDCKWAKASKKGIYAAGDVTTDPFKQNNIAAGDGVRAALSAYYYLMNMEKHSPCKKS
jgi:alkyl hydroperoxide reductase subunit F